MASGRRYQKHGGWLLSGTPKGVKRKTSYHTKKGNVSGAHIHRVLGVGSPSVSASRHRFKKLSPTERKALGRYVSGSLRRR